MSRVRSTNAKPQHLPPASFLVGSGLSISTSSVVNPQRTTQVKPSETQSIHSPMRVTDLLACIVTFAAVASPGAVASGDATGNATATVSRSLVEQCYNYYTDIDMPGYDWYKIAAGSVLSCRIQCLIEDNCKAFTWTNQNGGTCYVKTGYSTKGAKYVQGAVTGIKGCDANLLTILNCDMDGNDVANERAASVDLCVLGCITRDPPDCNAWTWSDYNGGTCWLKSRVSTCQGDGNNKYSGVIGPQNWY